MGSDLYMNPPTWEQLTPEERRRTVKSKSQEENLAQEEFRKWYKVNVAERDDPDRVLFAWQAYWAGYRNHKNLN